jgi:hypothetical protein
MSATHAPSPVTTAPLAELRLLSLRLTIRPLTPLVFGATAVGGVLRGAFGETLKRLVCAFDWKTAPCRTCSLRATCAYPQVFEPEAPEGGPSGYRDPPRPYVVKPPLEGEKTYAAGETLTFGLTLFSERVSALLPYFLVTWRELGDQGIALRRSRFVLERVESRNEWAGLSHEVYEAGTGVVRTPRVTITGDDVRARAEQMPSDRVRVRFLTPTLLKHEGNFLQHPPFHVLFRRARDRLGVLAATFGPGGLALDWAALAERAAAVRTEASDMRWVKSARLSSRTGESQALGGAVGSVVYAGELGDLRLLLAAAELLHVGKDAVFGNGWIRVEPASA